MTRITDNYALEFNLNDKQEIDFVSYYFKMARQLGDVAEHYNRSMSEDIFMGYSEVAQMIENLAIMYKNNKSGTDITSAKETIFNEFNGLILDLEGYFESRPDEITERDIKNGKVLALGFSIQS